MTKERRKQLADKILITGKGALEKFGSMMPLLFVSCTDKKEVGIIPVSGKSKEETNLILKKAGKIVAEREKNLDEVFLLTETWFATIKKEGFDVDGELEMPIHDMPDRKEALILVSSTPEKECTFFLVAPFKKEDDKYVFEKEVENDGEGSVNNFMKSFWDGYHLNRINN